MGRFSIIDGAPTGGLWGTRGLGGKGQGGSRRMVIYVYITMTDLHFCMAEINTRV